MSTAARIAPLPRVTAILRDAGLCGDMTFVPQSALDRGTAVHAATHFLDESDLDTSSVDPQVAPYLDGYTKWLAEMRPEILAIEEEVVHPAYGYAGRLDRRIRLHGVEMVVDLKCGLACPRWHSLQTCLYAMTVPRPVKRACLHVADGKYRFREHPERVEGRPNDRAVCMSLLTLHAWKQAGA